MIFDRAIAARGGEAGPDLRGRSREGEKWLGTTRQGIPVVMDAYAVDPAWGTEEEEREKKRQISWVASRSFEVFPKEGTSGPPGQVCPPPSTA